jgi:Capsule polysaccharide export protein
MVGGTYWGAQPRLPRQYSLLRDARAWETCRNAIIGTPVFWNGAFDSRASPCNTVIGADCDPWHVLRSADRIFLNADDEVRVIASLIGVPAYIYDPSSNRIQRDDEPTATLLNDAIGPFGFRDPFTNEELSLGQAVELCGFWRELIDSNRDIRAAMGFAFWKQERVAPLLWNGSAPTPFVRKPGDIPSGGSVAVWRAKASADAVSQLERSGVPMIEVEDGFLRSKGLGADCVPPLSITVDRLGPHFDPKSESELEWFLEKGAIAPDLISRAKKLRKLIVSNGITKYGGNKVEMARPAANRCHILVPGQVEDDRAVQSGGCGLVSNLELLKRVRANAPDAYILYKPHPDVAAGHRKGGVASMECLQYADVLADDVPISALFEIVDEIHVNTSLSGFEALMRDKPVTTYGVPFYAGWKLTTDLGPVPARRTRRRSIDELVAAALLVYPRYLDPKSGLPCPAEVAVARLAEPEERRGPLVAVRRLQGKFMRRLRSARR